MIYSPPLLKKNLCYFIVLVHTNTFVYADGENKVLKSMFYTGVGFVLRSTGETWRTTMLTPGWRWLCRTVWSTWRCRCFTWGMGSWAEPGAILGMWMEKDLLIKLARGFKCNEPSFPGPALGYRKVECFMIKWLKRSNKKKKTQPIGQLVLSRSQGSEWK